MARRFCPDHGVATCHRHFIPGAGLVDVYHLPGRDGAPSSACFGGLVTCHSAWACPVCAGKIAEQRRGELAHALAVHRGDGGAVYLLTYTARHRQGTELRAFLESLLKAVATMRGGKAFAALRARYGHAGSIRATEITLGGNGWHPHFHELWFGKPGDGAALRAAIKGRWLAALERHSLAGLPAIAADVREASMTVDDYVTKYGRERRWDIDAEITRGISKRGRGKSLTPFDLLRRGLAAAGGKDVLDECRDYYREYVLATKDKSSLQWSPGLKDRMGVREVSDAAVAEGVDALGSILGRIGYEDWRRILAADARAQILRAAATGSWQAVDAVLGALPPAPEIRRSYVPSGRARSLAR